MKTRFGPVHKSGFAGLVAFLALFSSCAPIIKGMVSLSYDGGLGNEGNNNHSLWLTPTLFSPGASNNSITNCQLQSGSANASLFPSSFAVNPLTCVISGTPITPMEPTLFTVQMTNNIGQTASANVILSVNSGWAYSTVAASAASSFGSVRTDSAGNIYAVGSISGNSTFDFGNSVTVTSPYSGSSGLIVKYDPYGVAQWARTLTVAPNTSSFASLAIDSSDNVYIAGSLWGNSTFNFGNGVTATPVLYNNTNVMVVKYNSSGLAQWAKTTTAGNTWSKFDGVAVDASNNVYAVGSVYGNTVFGFGNSVTGSGAATYGSANVMIVKYNSAGLAQWAQSTSASSGGTEFVADAVDSSGNVYAVGEQSQNSVGYGNGVVSSGSVHSWSLLIVKYDPTGLAQWAKTTQYAPSGSYYSSVAVDPSDNVYAVGGVSSGSGYIIGNSVSVNGGYSGSNALVAKYDPSGTVLWTNTTTTASNSSAFNSVNTDTSGNVYVVGYLNGSSSFGFGNGLNVAGPYSGGTNLVLLKYSSSGLAQWAQLPSSASAGSNFNDVVVDSSGAIYAVGSLSKNSSFAFGNGITVAGAYSGGVNSLIVKYAF